MANLTLTADAASVAATTVGCDLPGVSIRSSRPDDREALAELYFRSYEPGIACATEEAARDDVDASFAGAYGEYLHDASPVMVEGPMIVGAVMTVRRAPWDDTPTCPFIIELFTSPDHRRLGVAATLLAATAQASSKFSESIALRVDERNEPALALYERLGFRRWDGD